MLILGVWYVTVMAILFVLVCLLMMAVILIQKPRGGGLSGAFGGAGGSAQSAFGAKTGDFLTWLTCGFFVAFLLLAIGLTWAIPPTTAPTTSSISSPATPTTPGTPGTPAGSTATPPPAPAAETPTPAATTATPATTQPSEESKP